MPELGRTLVGVGLGLVLVGGLVLLVARLGLPLGRLPGDFVVRRDGFTLYLPLGTSIVVSIALSLVAYLFRR